MRYNVIENTDITVSHVAYGTASLHRVFRAKERQRLLEAAAEIGITHFDTSPFYGFGLAEKDLGRFLRGRRSRFTVTTKVGLYSRGHAGYSVTSVWMRKAVGKVAPKLSLPEVNWEVSRASMSLKASLQRLNTEYVDFLLLHEPVFGLVAEDEFVRWIEQEVSKGTVRAWGVAGASNSVRPFVVNRSPLAKVIQTQDTLEKGQADFVLKWGRKLQFTYGYISSSLQTGQGAGVVGVLRQALQRNPTGAVIVSSTRVRHIQDFGATQEC